MITSDNCKGWCKYQTVTGSHLITEFPFRTMIWYIQTISSVRSSTTGPTTQCTTIVGMLDQVLIDFLSCFAVCLGALPTGCQTWSTKQNERATWLVRDPSLRHHWTQRGPATRSTRDRVPRNTNHTKSTKAGAWAHLLLSWGCFMTTYKPYRACRSKGAGLGPVGWQPTALTDSTRMGLGPLVCCLGAVGWQPTGLTDSKGRGLGRFSAILGCRLTTYCTALRDSKGMGLGPLESAILGL